MASLVTSNTLCSRVDTNETATSEMEKEHESISTTEMIMEEEEDGGTSGVSPSGTVVADRGSSLTSATDNTFKTPQAPKVEEDVEGVGGCVCKCVCVYVHMYIYNACIYICVEASVCVFWKQGRFLLLHHNAADSGELGVCSYFAGISLLHMENKLVKDRTVLAR